MEPNKGWPISVLEKNDMKYTGKEAKRIIEKVRLGETTTDAEKAYLVEVAKKSMKLLPDSVGTWMLVTLVVMMSTTGERELIDEVLDALF